MEILNWQDQNVIIYKRGQGEFNDIFGENIKGGILEMAMINREHKD